MKTVNPYLQILFFIIASLITVSGIACADERQDKINKLVETAWVGIEQNEDGWIYRISPEFPISWPDTKRTKTVYYVFATRIDLQRTADGERVAAPWATIQVDSANNGSSPTLVIKNRKLVELGIQGVRPLTQEEAKAYKEIGISKTGISRQGYCTWIKNNSLLSRAIELDQRNFFNWLQCEIH